MLLYNSLTRKKEEFIPNEDGKVKMYTCGPTVYNYAHIGNYRSYIFEDVLVKSLEYIGYDVTRAMNITDVGHLSGDTDTGKDKMVEQAKSEHKDVLEIAKFYTEAFKEGFNKLNLKWPSIVVPATSCIDTYIEMITKLLEKGYAYKSNGNVYFDISKLDKYNVFSNQDSEDMIVGARDNVSEDLGKKNPYDFALWFTKSKFENQALKWDSPWGVGYPGWHIECSGISYKYLGEYLDIHCGGIDNKFPHHTNEIAQSESFLGHKWCNYWFHVLHLTSKNGKMSKSSGEFITIDTLINKGYDPLVYKFFCLGSDYRKELVFSYEALDSAKVAYNRVLNKISKLTNEGELEEDKIKEYQDKFKDAINNDLNTSSMLTVLFDLLKSELNDNTKLYLVKDFDKVLSLSLISDTKNEKIDNEEFILNKIEERKNAKKNKDFELADTIRKELLDMGIELTDTREGTTYKVIK